MNCRTVLDSRTVECMKAKYELLVKEVGGKTTANFKVITNAPIKEDYDSLKLVIIEDDLDADTNDIVRLIDADIKVNSIIQSFKVMDEIVKSRGVVYYIVINNIITSDVLGAFVTELPAKCASSRCLATARSMMKLEYPHKVKIAAYFVKPFQDDSSKRSNARIAYF